MSPRRIRILAAVLALAGAAAAAGAGLLVAGEAAPQQQETEASQHETQAAGAPAPRLAGVDPVTSERVALRSFRGRPVVLAVWASWCSECAEGADALRRFAARHSEAAVVGLDYQDTPAGAADFYRRWRWRHPSIGDPDGALASRLGLTTLPASLVYNRRLRLVVRLEGPQSLNALEAALQSAKSSS